MFSRAPARLCLFGSGGHGRVVAAIATRLWPSDIIFGDANLPLGTLIDGIQVEVSSLRELNDHRNCDCGRQPR